MFNPERISVPEYITLESGIGHGYLYRSLKKACGWKPTKTKMIDDAAADGRRCVVPTYGCPATLFHSLFGGLS
jgi:hypothetical protein